jgi:hypothetical protein
MTPLALRTCPDVRAGTRRDAILHAVGANAAYGPKRTNRDKRNAVMTLLRDSEWSQWSDAEMARRAIVSPHTVASLRASIPVTMQTHSEPQQRTYTMKHGTTATMNTAAIGARLAPAVAASAPEWRQSDIEDFAPLPWLAMAELYAFRLNALIITGRKAHEYSIHDQSNLAESVLSARPPDGLPNAAERQSAWIYRLNSRTHPAPRETGFQQHSGAAR